MNRQKGRHFAILCTPFLYYKNAVHRPFNQYLSFGYVYISSRGIPLFKWLTSEMHLTKSNTSNNLQKTLNCIRVVKMNKTHQTNIVILIILSIITTRLSIFLSFTLAFTFLVVKFDRGTWTSIDPTQQNTLNTLSPKLWFNNSSNMLL